MDRRALGPPARGEVVSDIVQSYVQPEAAHWYGANGEPRHDATLREARKERLFPSVTSVLGIKEKPQLTQWKIAQMVAQALTMTRLPGENDYLFIKRVQEADEAERAKAPDLGKAVHLALASYFSGSVYEAPEKVDMGPVLDWITAHAKITGARVEERFVSPLGFGGCIDYVGLVDGRPALIDWKTQSVKKAPAFYDEWAWQLAAYGLGTDPYMGCDLWSVVIDTAHQGCYAQKWSPSDVARAWAGFKGLLEAWFADRKFDPRVEDLQF